MRRTCFRTTFSLKLSLTCRRDPPPCREGRNRMLVRRLLARASAAGRPRIDAPCVSPHPEGTARHGLPPHARRRGRSMRRAARPARATGCTAHTGGRKPPRPSPGRIGGAGPDGSGWQVEIVEHWIEEAVETRRTPCGPPRSRVWAHIVRGLEEEKIQLLGPCRTSSTRSGPSRKGMATDMGMAIGTAIDRFRINTWKKRRRLGDSFHFSGRS
jgi:hypothetical protein